MLVDPLEQRIKQLDAVQFKQMLITATNNLKDFEEEINDLNIFPVPDGDTGTNMYLTLSNAVEELESIEEDSVSTVANSLAMGALMGARGNSGVILSQLLKGLADGLSNVKVMNSQNLADGLQEAANKAYQAVMKPVEGTILTVAKDVGNRAQSLAEELNVVELLAEVVKEAEKSVAKTPELLETLKEAGVVDAGGKGYQIFLNGLLQGVTAKSEGELDNNRLNGNNIMLKKADKGTSLSQARSEFGYCTEFIIKDANVEVDDFREELVQYGDSLLVVKADDILKVHIHSNHPGQVLEEGLKYGELSNIKIDNMSEQHKEKIKKETETSPKDVSDNKNSDRLAVLSVVVGSGLEDVFKQFGVNYVLQGGQSMNPSIQDLLTGINEIQADKIIILPNNKNIIPTAEQAKELSSKNIEVVPTQTIPQGVAAMMAFNPTGDILEVKIKMEEEIEYIKTGQITYAVRDTKVKGLNISKEDILGLEEGDITIVGSDYNQATIDLLKEMVEDEDSLITIYVGKDVNSAKQKELVEMVRKEYPDYDIEIYDGEQPIYYYIISVE